MLAQLIAFLGVIIHTLSAPAPLIVSRSIPMATVAGAPEINAESVFLIDMARGEILFAKNADDPRPIASITKLMTALTILDSRPNWGKEAMFEKQDQRYGDIAYLLPGEKLAFEDAWKLMLVSSSNDAASLLARAAFNSEARFVEEMNKKAAAFGLRFTRFVDPTGLKAENISTAREVAALARAALSFPKIRNTVTQERFTFAPVGGAHRTVFSTDWLLRSFKMPGVEVFGGKTGHIEESKYNLVFAAGNDGHELIGVVLGSEDNAARFSEMNKLIKWGFSAVPKEQSLGD